MLPDDYDYDYDVDGNSDGDGSFFVEWGTGPAVISTAADGVLATVTRRVASSNNYAATTMITNDIANGIHVNGSGPSNITLEPMQGEEPSSSSFPLLP